MIQVLVSWGWLGLSAFLWGFAFLWIVEKVSGYKKKTLDIVVFTGLCFLTVYAQVFSLFYKVGLVASLILLIIDIFICVCLRKSIINQVVQWRSVKGTLYKLLAVIGVFCVLLMISATSMKHYDTYLYHAQSIRWIEEYGVVPGLGVLHNRLAYNSAIFPLQALFSLSFVMDRSLHSVNGFVVALLVSYVLYTLKVFKEKRFCVSDFVRVAISFFLFQGENRLFISSPGSDILALGLVVYILAKWITYWEDGERDIAPYAILCLLGVYATSVKLSAAMIVLLVILPAFNLIKQKRWMQIVFYLFTGIVIIAPFLIRNVIISGYLLYPYPELDIFNVDWKMPEYTLLFDRNEIKAWGWGLNDVYRYDAPVTEWFPVWINRLGSIMEKLFYLNFVLIIPMTIGGILQGLKKKDWNGLNVVIAIVACLALWFIGSPLPRYGSVFLILLPVFTLGCIVVYFQGKKKWGGIAGLITVVCLLVCLKPAVDYVRTNEFTELKCPDYYAIDAKESVLGDEIIYCPVQGDQMGYYAFPSTPYVSRLQLIELRGDTLSAGFKMKDEYREAFVTTYGEVHAENMFGRK